MIADEFDDTCRCLFCLFHIDVIQQQGKYRSFESCNQTVFFEFRLQNPGDIGEIFICIGDTNAITYLFKLVNFDKQDSTLGLAFNGLSNQFIYLVEEESTVIQASEQVLFAQHIKLLFQFLAVTAITNDNLGAGFAFHTGACKFHRCFESMTIGMFCLDVQRIILALSLGIVTQEVFQFTVVFASDHIKNGHAFNIIQTFVTIHIQISLVRIDMHSVVHISNGIA